jgi:hypothetical protein
MSGSDVAETVHSPPHLSYGLRGLPSRLWPDF